MANPKYAVSDKPVPVSELVATLTDGTKVKRRIPRMRACNEKDEKGKLCAEYGEQQAENFSFTSASGRKCSELRR